MPRKKKGMMFELLPRPTTDENGKPLLYARPASTRKWSIGWIDEFCSKYRAIPSGEVNRVFETFLEVAVSFMMDGSRVITPIGSFAPKLKIKGDFSDPKKVKHSDVYLAGIEFIPSKRFIQELENRLDDGFLKYIDPYDREAVRSKITLEEALQKSLRKGYTTIRAFCGYSGLKYVSARRFLNSLCEGDSPRLERIREGHQLHYRPLVSKGTK